MAGTKVRQQWHSLAVPTQRSGSSRSAGGISQPASIPENLPKSRELCGEFHKSPNPSSGPRGGASQVAGTCGGSFATRHDLSRELRKSNARICKGIFANRRGPARGASRIVRICGERNATRPEPRELRKPPGSAKLVSQIARICDGSFANRPALRGEFRKSPRVVRGTSQIAGICAGCFANRQDLRN